MEHARRLLSAVLLSTLAFAAAAAQPQRYTVLVDGNPRAGHMVIRPAGDGGTRVSFAYLHGGRGPRLEERYTLAPDGTYLGYSAKGTAASGEPVDESFRHDGRPGLYMPAAGSPARLDVAVAALARQPGGTLALRPDGRLRAQVIGGLDLIRRGERRTVELLALTGMGTLPTLAWATDEPEPRLFAYLAPDGVLLVEAGWESVADALERRQRRAVADEVRELQDALAHPVEDSLLIRGARIFDSEGAALGPAGNVLVRDGRIVEVDTSGGESRAARTAGRVVEAGGRTLLPGLFDAAAAEGWSAPLRLAAGVTTVRPESRPAVPTGPARTDPAPGDATFVDRLERRVASGASPASVLQAATWGAARDAGLLDERGSIAVGKRADLVLVDGDPTADITALRRTALVLKGNALFHPSEIRRAYGLAPTTAPIWPAAPQPRGRSRLDAEAQPLPSRYYD